MTYDAQLRQTAAALGTPRVLVVGDLMLDRYSWCDVERISPEAPIPVLEIKREESYPGGASNVAVKCVELGCPTDIAGVVGPDADGDELVRRLAAAGVGTSAIVRANGRPTTSKHRFVARTQQVIRADREFRSPIDAETEAKLLADVLLALADADALVISDYSKGTLPPSLLAAIIAAANEKGIPIVVDPKGRDFTRYAGTSILTPNTKEACVAVGLDGPDEETFLYELAKRTLAVTHSPWLVITRASKGMIVYSAAGEARSYPARRREVFDVTGAGDAVTATFAISMGSGLTPFDAAQLATVAAGIIVSQIGVGHVTRADLMSAVYGGIVSSAEKVVARERLARDLANVRASGKKVVFTNGCFDIIHYGHVKLLERAREFGEALVVGLNSDASVRRLKGADRPIVGEKERAAVLAAIAAVDFVCVFDEDTPLQLIEAIRPDVLVKGGDYRVETVVGAPEVKSWGGSVEIVPLIEGFSTTGIVGRVKSADAKAGE
ncbi:MAG: D-glycero-beta-D-manno-heptose 1-phosphate adenylyltransferase [Candidatus Brocadiia bacterium]